MGYDISKWSQRQMDEFLRGLHAAQKREPVDVTQPLEWLVGYLECIRPRSIEPVVRGGR